MTKNRVLESGRKYLPVVHGEILLFTLSLPKGRLACYPPPIVIANIVQQSPGVAYLIPLIVTLNEKMYCGGKRENGRFVSMNASERILSGRLHS